MRVPSMPKYFFNVVMNGHQSVDAHGRQFRDHHEAHRHAEYAALMLADPARDHTNSFIAVTGEDGRLAFKVPFPQRSRTT